MKNTDNSHTWTIFIWFMCRRDKELKIQIFENVNVHIWELKIYDTIERNVRLCKWILNKFNYKARIRVFKLTKVYWYDYFSSLKYISSIQRWLAICLLEFHYRMSFILAITIQLYGFNESWLKPWLLLKKKMLCFPVPLSKMRLVSLQYGRRVCK